ncbi:hypothetical protein B0J18DRAFT_100554 [Chaetomium sp. MPI-SDFR-AT-0129]|nr:hypothetical protein B0J18DRAFT_100554 [Chaetomium sp. MPI-SDFR-AT-0129]
MARCADRSDAQYRAIFGVLEHFIRTKLKEAALTTSVAVINTAETEGAIEETTKDRAALPCYYIPLPENRRFVGREKALDALKAMFFVQKECQKASIVGLGGVGKTQVALQLAYWTKKNQPEFSIFWVPALSMASFEQAMTAIAKKLPIQETGEDEDPKESVQRFLSSEAAGSWLLVVDNADDEEILFGSADRPGGISDYLPESDTGLTLFTTRFQEVAVSATGSDVVELNEMEHAEAVDFLEKSLIHKSLLRDETATTELLRELTYLPLAITQAAAYINKKKIPLTEYIGLLYGTQQDVIGLMSKEFRDSTRYPGSQNAVATTWLVSFDQIRKSDSAAADLLSFISRIEPKGIPQSLLPDLDSAEKFVDAIGTLCAYAFLTRRGESKVFDMHSLVHLATQIWVQREGLTATTDEDATWHLATIFPTADYENRNTWREYLPHALKLLQNSRELDTEERSDLLLAVGRCLDIDGRTDQAVEIIEEACEWPDRTLAKDDPSRLATRRTLGEVYHSHCRFKDAIDVLEEVVDIEARVLANDHPTRLASQHALAAAYQANGQTEEAIILLEQIVAIEAGMLAEDHNDRLRSQHTLAMAYHANGQLKESIALFEQLVAIKARVLPKDHFNQLSSQHALAMAYQANGQVAESIALLERVVAVETQAFPEDHYLLLTSQHGLARAYQTNGQMEKAMALLEHVVAVRAQGLSDDHLSRLASEYSLAVNYHANGEVKRAITMLEQILKTETRDFCDDEPLRLKSQVALAKAYQTNGQVKAAIGLLEHVVTHYTEVLPEDHPTRLETEEWLAYSYTSANDGRVNEAVALLERVVAIKGRVLAEDHPSRLSSQQALAITYGANGQIKEAVPLLEHVVAMKARIFPGDHPSLLASQDWLASMTDDVTEMTPSDRSQIVA